MISLCPVSYQPFEVVVGGDRFIMKLIHTNNSISLNSDSIERDSGNADMANTYQPHCPPGCQRAAIDNRGPTFSRPPRAGILTELQKKQPGLGVSSDFGTVSG